MLMFVVRNNVSSLLFVKFGCDLYEAAAAVKRNWVCFEGHYLSILFFLQPAIAVILIFEKCILKTGYVNVS